MMITMINDNRVKLEVFFSFFHRRFCRDSFFRCHFAFPDWWFFFSFCREDLLYLMVSLLAPSISGGFLAMYEIQFTEKRWKISDESVRLCVRVAGGLRFMYLLEAFLSAPSITTLGGELW